MAHTRRNIVFGALAAAIAGGLIYVTIRPEPVAVDLHEVTRGPFVVTVDVDGVTRVMDMFEVAAPITGVAQRSPVEVGDPVTSNETVVAQVEPVSPGLLDTRTRLQSEAAVREAEASLHVAETERVRAEEDRAYAQSQHDRIRRLLDRNVASLTQLEDAQQRLAVANAALDAAEARITQARSSLERAEAALVETSELGENPACCVPIYAPSDGVVLTIDTISERPVTAGDRLLTVGDPAQLEIVADLLSSDAVRLPDQARASIERWGGPHLEARLTKIEPAARTEVSALGIDEQRVDAIFEITSPAVERAGLGHDFAVFLRIVEYEEEDALLVPLSAAFRAGNDWAVFRIRDDRAERVMVELGRRNARFAVVTDGLTEGDRVVGHPSEELTDGALILERTTFLRISQ